ncbi:hypothetical protein KMW28_21120 [Flammeovirga yaeyamensis]|uniref:Uncharacterized protein n=1 Tax=Flammeovirga yaeyamensis TaxID=367791 RepID=A0AAX1NEP5_9BACT|nr:hypothetical protein [Flammeovirga yaeyamensis]MBB3697148.1 hypothetical protein [Flammeovirga yaeyamensis]NMF33809.1 hypothetical protein [Flammeovirga yaeyamensis]QWG04927.1 hypothetical protein KMW28_21120 [Flammeovirga yaeyamensis]
MENFKNILSNKHVGIIISFSLHDCWDVFLALNHEKDEADALQRQIDVLMGNADVDDSEYAYFGIAYIIEHIFEHNIFKVTHTAFPSEFFDNTYIEVDGETADIHIELVDDLSRAGAAVILEYFEQFEKIDYLLKIEQ